VEKVYTAQDKVKEFLHGFLSLLGAISLALLVRFLVYSPFHIPSGSMIPTLRVGDYLFVSNFTYGYSKFSLPFGYMLPGLKGRLFEFKKPKQGDVIVFRLPTDQATDYVKRVIGLPGDTVEVKDGIVYVNGIAATVQKKGPYHQQAEVKGGMVNATLYEETLPNGKKHMIIKEQPWGQGAYDNMPPRKIPAGHYFVMGDNRDGSLDSRAAHAIGTIPRDFIIGAADLIFFSTNDTARWWEPHKWLGATRYSRFFNVIR
jgi:signal peptidase I